MKTADCYGCKWLIRPKFVAGFTGKSGWFTWYICERENRPIREIKQCAINSEHGAVSNIYRYGWKNDNSGPDITDYSAYPAKRKHLYGRECKVLARGKKNSVLVEFTDTGQHEIVSRNALRRTGKSGKTAQV